MFQRRFPTFYDNLYPRNIWDRFYDDDFYRQPTFKTKFNKPCRCDQCVLREMIDCACSKCSNYLAQNYPNRNSKKSRVGTPMTTQSQSGLKPHNIKKETITPSSPPKEDNERSSNDSDNIDFRVHDNKPSKPEHSEALTNDNEEKLNREDVIIKDDAKNEFEITNRIDTKESYSDDSVTEDISEDSRINDVDMKVEKEENLGNISKEELSEIEEMDATQEEDETLTSEISENQTITEDKMEIQVQNNDENSDENESKEENDSNDRTEKPSSYLEEQMTVIKNIDNDVNRLVEKYLKKNEDANKKDLIYFEEMLVQALLKLDRILTNGKDEIRSARKEVVKKINQYLELIEKQLNNNL